MKNWNIEAITGYKPKTTFYLDFSIAEPFGKSAVKDTAKRAFEAWQNDIEYLTELAMALNWKVWEHYEQNESLAYLYNDLWLKLDEWIYQNKNTADLNYYIRTTN